MPLDSSSILIGFATLRPADQQKVEELIALANGDDKASTPQKPSPASAKKSDSNEDPVTLYWTVRDKLKKSLSLSATDMKSILRHNGINDRGGDQTLLDRLADGIVFGKIPACPICHESKMEFEDGHYKCHGMMSEWSSCTHVINTEIERENFLIPAGEDWDELRPLIPKSRKLRPVTAKPVKETTTTTPTQIPDKLFKGYTFVLAGDLSSRREELSPIIKENGGLLGTTVTKRVSYVLVDESVTKDDNLSQLKTATKHGIPVVRLGWFEECVKQQAIVPVKDFHVQGPDEPMFKKERTTGSKRKKEEEEDDEGQESKKVKVVLKNGKVAVDEDCDYAETGRVYEEGKTLWNAVLNQTDMGVGERGLNSFYLIQLIATGSDPPFAVFYKWGRIGMADKQGGSKTVEFDDVHDAKEAFKKKFGEKTGNRWEDRADFKKVSGKMFLIELDMSDEILKPSLSLVPSKLHPKVQSLMTMIFDQKLMQDALVEMEIDIKKMPLGKLKKSNIQQGFKLLGEIQQLLDKNSETSSASSPDETKARLMDFTNQFFTTIPHDFGKKKPPLLETSEMIQKKLTMLSTLEDMEIAQKLIREGTSEGVADENMLDIQYSGLKCGLDPIDEGTDDFEMIQKYLVNTHAATHDKYKLEVVDIFKVNREGESSRYAAFSPLPNKMLLWHGSRTTNFVGILSQGLRIAPPEAPSTGYMFGKGIYLADMSSKSANYCFINSTGEGCLLLCEAALGKMLELKQAKSIVTVPRGSHSVKGLGTTMPNPKDTIQWEKDIAVPLGKGVPSKVKDTTLLYNEYIIYSVEQVRIRYLVKVKFNYPSR